MDNPSPNAKPHSPWARRQMNAHDNAVENLVIFAILVLVANALHIFNNVTAAACATYFWARLAHYVIYTMGVPVLRTLTFVAGFAAEIVLVLAIFPLDLRQQANRLSSNRRVRVRHEDVPLVRDVVRAVADPQRESEARC